MPTDPSAILSLISDLYNQITGLQQENAALVQSQGALVQSGREAAAADLQAEAEAYRDQFGSGAKPTLDGEAAFAAAAEFLRDPSTKSLSNSG